LGSLSDKAAFHPCRATSDKGGWTCL